MAHVVGDVEVRVVDPHRTTLFERDERQPLAVARDEVQPRTDRVKQLFVGGRPAAEDGAAGDVHVRRAVLEMQEGTVEAGQPVGIRHRQDSCRRGWGTTAGALGATLLCEPAHTIRSWFLPAWASRIRPAESLLQGAEASGGPTAGYLHHHPAGANRLPGPLTGGSCSDRKRCAVRRARRRPRARQLTP